MAYEITLKASGIPVEDISAVLEEKGIRINEYARLYMSHRAFRSDALCFPMRLMVMALWELGFKTEASFSEILKAAEKLGLYPCAPATGLFLRLNMPEQKVSQTTVLTGTHSAPEGAITVVSHLLEADAAFPRGLYLRNVDGTLWLRGYVCADDHPWKSSDVFAFEIKEQ